MLSFAHSAMVDSWHIPVPMGRPEHPISRWQDRRPSESAPSPEVKHLMWLGAAVQDAVDRGELAEIGDTRRWMAQQFQRAATPNAPLEIRAPLRIVEDEPSWRTRVGDLVIEAIELTAMYIKIAFGGAAVLACTYAWLQWVIYLYPS